MDDGPAQPTTRPRDEHRVRALRQLLTYCATKRATIHPRIRATTAVPTELLRTSAVAHPNVRPGGRSRPGCLRHDPVPPHPDGPSSPCLRVIPRLRVIPCRHGTERHRLSPPTTDPRSGTRPQNARTRSRPPPTSSSGTEAGPTTYSGRGGGKTGVP